MLRRPIWQSVVGMFMLGIAIGQAWAADMDLTLPTMNGLTLLREVADQKPESGPLQLGAGSFPIRAYAARSAHPRLYLLPPVEATLREWLKHPDPRLAAYWSRLLQEAKTYANEQPPEAPAATEDPFRGFGDRLPVLAFAYRLSGDPALLAGTVTWLRAVIGYPSWPTDLGIAHCLFGVVATLDWLGDKLPAGLRESARERARTEAAKVYELQRDGKVEWHFTRLQNHYWINNTALLAAGLYFFGELPEAETWAAYAQFKLRQTDELLPPDGCDHEGFEYWEYGVEWLIRGAELRRALLGEDRVYDTPFWRNTAWYRIYCALPGWNQGVQIGDCSFTRRYGPGYHMEKLAALAGAGAILDAGDRIERTYGGIASAPLAWQYVLYYDPKIRSGDVTREPPSRVFDDHGIYLGRTDWSDQATYLAFKAGPPLGQRATEILRRNHQVDCGCAHVHPDNGAVWLYSRGQGLIIPPGYVHLKTSSFENVLLVDGKGQLGECLMALYGTPYIEQATEPRLLHAELSAGSDYVLGDLTPAYPRDRGLTRWRRGVLLLRPATVVIVDDLATQDPRQLEVQFHCAAAGDVEVDASSARFRVTRSGAGLAAQVFYLPPEDVARVNAGGGSRPLSPSGLGVYQKPLLIPPHMRHGDHNVTFDQKVIYLGPRGDAPSTALGAGASAAEIGRSNGGLVVTVIRLGDENVPFPAGVAVSYEPGHVRIRNLPGATRDIVLDLPAQ